MASALLKDPRQLVIHPPSPGLDKLPPAGLPEIAIAGRSNVGKSSLINRLLGTRKAARVSATPGKTRLIHIYEIPGKLRLVDLPGYGYARVSKSERTKWAVEIGRYLNERQSLRGIIALVDSRHEASELDGKMLDYCDQAGLPAVIAFTKCDGVRPSQLRSELRARCEELSLDPQDTIATSAENGIGLEDLAAAVLRLAATPERS